MTHTKTYAKFDAWAQTLPWTCLVDDPGLRQQMGMTARGEASGSILQATNRQWEAALQAPGREAA